MQLTRGAEYAIRAVLDLTANYTGLKDGKMQLKDIAARLDIPYDFLAKIFQMLNHSGIIKSYRGTKGGYTLAREPKNINVKDVIYAVDGPIRLNKCLNAEGCVVENNCKYQPECPVHDVWREAQNSMLKVLSEASFHSLNQKMINK
jgi:Rrf2 family protein